MPAFERQFGNAGLIELTQTFVDHAAILFERRGGERKIQPGFLRQFERDAGILGGVSGAEKTGVFAVLHVFTIGRENTGTRAGLRKYFAQHG